MLAATAVVTSVLQMLVSYFAPQLAELAALSNGFARLSFCVATDGDESRLARALPEETAFVGRFLPFSVADNAEDMDRAMHGAAIGRELWRHAAFPLLALLLAEIALTRWITQQRRTGEEGKVDFGETDAANTRFAAFVAELTARRAGSLSRNERGAP